MNSLDDLAARLTCNKLITDPQKTQAYRRDEAHLVEPGEPLAVLLAGPLPLLV